MIRQFQPEDAQACSDLIHDCVEADSSIAPAVRQKLLRAESPHVMRERARDFYVGVYELNGAVAGVGGLEMNEIRMLFVAPAQQGKGIGRAILEHLEAMVPPALFQDIFVYSTASALGFYRAHGYQPRGESLFDIDGQPLPTIFMTKPTGTRLA